MGKGFKSWCRQQWRHTVAIACVALVIMATLASPLVPEAIAQEVRVSPDFEAKVLKVIDDNPEAILKSVGKYNRIQAERRAQAQSQFRLSLRTNPDSVIAGSPVKGNTDAPITLIEFSDFQCPFCAQAQGEIQRFMSRYGNRVQFVYKHLPLSNIHAQAVPAAAASWAAQQQGKFWPYHDDLYKNQSRLGEELYLELADKHKLDIDQFNSDRASQGAIAAIQKDLDLAETLSIQGTPTFVMDGVILNQAPSAENLTAAFEAASQQR
ncbi:MAG: DsbA family protein [Cyanophyceae cyanobacterium]